MTATLSGVLTILLLVSLLTSSIPTSILTGSPPRLAVEISDINLFNISGYASGNYKAIGNTTVGSIRCSGECENITARDINLAWGQPGEQQEGQYFCTNVASLDQLSFECIDVPYDGTGDGSNLNPIQRGPGATK